ncbi:hypothetical protein [Micromonospora sp. KC213]|uniref:hypothetical protein n=1 Tax=Micromonospora sp. KC213 TaxID=2530378 RepID=UPI00104E0551|nr:hypothetical protein [Micromonospora sp. KC213]TDC43024.1 hypothetical protein E1166_05670 [Micromonospora sp. KC213]
MAALKMASVCSLEAVEADLVHAAVWPHPEHSSWSQRFACPRVRRLAFSLFDTGGITDAEAVKMSRVPSPRH